MSELKIKYLLECQICGEPNEHWTSEVNNILAIKPCGACVRERALKEIQNLLPRLMRSTIQLAEDEDFDILDLCEDVEKAEELEELDDIFDGSMNKYYQKGG